MLDFCIDCHAVLDSKRAEIWAVCDQCFEKRLAIWLQKDPAKNVTSL